MLYAFGFERVGVLVGDLHFVDPAPKKGQEGAEHGVRLELRVLERGELRGSIYSAQPIEVGQPIWRADFLESVEGRPELGNPPRDAALAGAPVSASGASSASGSEPIFIRAGWL